MSTGLVKIDNSAVAQLEAIAKESQLAIQNAEGDMQRTFLMAAGMRQLMESITPEMMGDIMALQGSPLGFKTDKDGKGGYTVEEVKPCVVEGLLRGFYPVNNEINIIAGRFYGAKSGFERKVKTFPGLSNLEVVFGNPEQVAGNAYLDCVAVWQVEGREDRLERKKKRLKDGDAIDARICVRVNSGMGIDAIMGKAERKMYKAVYEHLTNFKDIIPDGDIEDAVTGQPLDKKVRKSGLFSDDPPAQSGPDEEASANALQNYRDRYDHATTRAEVLQILKEAGVDQRLMKPHKATANAWGNERVKEVSVRK